MDKNRPGKSPQEAEELRAVRFLLQGDAELSSSNCETRAVLKAAAGAISCAVETLAGLVKRGLICRSLNRVALTEAGRAFARRHRSMGEDFRAQHVELDNHILAESGERIEVAINLAESPLAQLARRKDRNGRAFLDAAELRAGERLRADYNRAQLMPRLGANWQAAVSSGRRDGGRGGLADLTDSAIAARQRVNHAVAAVGPELSGVLIDICCFLKGLETVEAERGWPVRSAKIMLKSALGALSRHYEPAARHNRHAVLHWGAEGYRPSLRTGAC